MKKVQVFLSTYNGEKYLQDQIESLLKQEGVQISILVRDDGSKDATIDILKKYKKAGTIDFYSGNNVGYAKSFMDLAKQNVHADYYAFCDQDDVWLPEKLYMAIKMIEKSLDDTERIPVLYSSALQRVDGDLNLLPLQSFKNLHLTLGGEFTRHRLAGCSFVFNNRLRNLLKRAEDIKCSHDKLATILCISCGGKVLFDKSSHILFRRHGNNTSPDGIGTKAKIEKDIHHYFSGQNDASGLAQQIINHYDDCLSEESKHFLLEIKNYKNSWFNTIKLGLSPEIDCGFWYFNVFIRAMIFMHFF